MTREERTVTGPWQDDVDAAAVGFGDVVGLELGLKGVDLRRLIGVLLE
jgi:hypothetical protein